MGSSQDLNLLASLIQNFNLNKKSEIPNLSIFFSFLKYWFESVVSWGNYIFSLVKNCVLVDLSAVVW